MPALHEVIVKPLITEKSSAAFQARKEYAFQVHPDANKFQIRDALLKLFGVTATDVRTMQMRRHEVTRGRTRGTIRPAGAGRPRSPARCSRPPGRS